MRILSGEFGVLAPRKAKKFQSRGKKKAGRGTSLAEASHYRGARMFGEKKVQHVNEDLGASPLPNVKKIRDGDIRLHPRIGRS